MFGFNKWFVVILFIAFIFGYELGWKMGLSIILIYAIVRFIWKLMT